jgi:hypothetical protein
MTSKHLPSQSTVLTSEEWGEQATCSLDAMVTFVLVLIVVMTLVTFYGHNKLLHSPNTSIDNERMLTLNYRRH